MNQGTVALILIFLEEAAGNWVNVADLARRLAMSDARVVDALRALPDYAPSIDLVLQLNGQGQVLAARVDNGAPAPATTVQEVF